ncbi:MAG: hypothetical protein IPH85_02275 [Ignavibacteria bacterium]|nr:hypothetical protein [Ignavibacteria bacterium]MBP7093359.1 hypothetical protein [Candidatus Kapabacteria bacterium]
MTFRARPLSTLFVIVAIAVIVPSCLFVKAPEQKTDVQNVALSPQPEIEMSDELVRTRAGDLIALMPKGWVFLDTKGDASADIVAIAVDPDYTLSMVVSSIPAAESSREQVQSEGLLGLARVAYQKHVRKSAGTAKLVGTYRIAELGPRRFGVYDFSTTGGAQRTRSAVCTSSLGNHYEVSLVPLNVSGKDVPDNSEQEKIFRSILATVQY